MAEVGGSTPSAPNQGFGSSGTESAFDRTRCSPDHLDQLMGSGSATIDFVMTWVSTLGVPVLVLAVAV